MAAITVRGATLAGMAVAARLAKVGHAVTLVHPADAPLGPTRLPSTIIFPAPWRDLFTKTGRPLAAELARTGHDLTPAPERRLADGVGLPAERGGQFHALSEAYGTRIAERWRDLLDEFDEVWQLRRPLGLEREFTPTNFRAARRGLRWGTSVATMARRFDHPTLSGVIAEAAEDDPRHSPADHVMWLSVERTFGRWQVTGPDGPASPRVLVDALASRLATRGVTVSATPPARADAIVVASGAIPRGWRGPRPWPRRSGSRTGERAYTCGDHTHAGRTVTGRLLSAALAAYAVHLDLTGEDIHPTNKDLAPRPRRKARATAPDSSL